MAEQSPFHADTGLLTALAELAVPVPCTGDTTLFRQNKDCFGLFILHSGQATLEMRSEAGEIIARFITDDGSLLSLAAALSGAPYSFTAAVLNGSRVSLIQRSKFLDLMTSDPALSLKALQVMTAEIRAAWATLSGALGRRQSHLQ